MALTAVITEPLISGNPDPYLYAGFSYVRFHGYDSVLDAGAHAIVDYEWSWGDGSPNTYGPIASHRYDTAGDKFPTLTVRDTVGAEHAIAIMVTFYTWTGTTFFVSDGSGNDANAGTSTGAPVKTLLHALVLANAATVAGAPVAVSLKLAESYAYPGPGILGDSGRLACPMIGSTWGSGADPIINVATGEWLWRAADAHAPQNDWGYSVQIKDWDVRWSTANTDDSAGDFRFGATLHGSTFINCKVTKGTYEATDGNLAPIKITWDNCEATGAGGHPGGGGIGFSNSGAGISSFFGVLNCNIHNNSAGRATNAYFHGDRLEVRGNIFDTENNGVVDSLLFSGVQKYVVMENIFRGGTNSCFSGGSNGSVDGSREAQDGWIEANYFEPIGTGINAQYLNRGVIKNNVVNGGSVGIYLAHSYVAYLTERTQNLDVLGNVLYGQSNQSIWTNGVRNLRFRNNGCVKSNSVPGGGGDSHFVQLGLSSQSTDDDYLYCTFDGNGYYDTLVSTSTDYAFVYNNSHKTFTQWQAAGFDAGSGSTTVFGQDPLLVNPAGGDFSIPTGSPWKNNGVATPEEFRDFTGLVRSSADATIDIGAFEFDAGLSINPAGVGTAEAEGAPGFTMHIKPTGVGIGPGGGSGTKISLHLNFGLRGAFSAFATGAFKATLKIVPTGTASSFSAGTFAFSGSSSTITMAGVASGFAAGVAAIGQQILASGVAGAPGSGSGTKINQNLSFMLRGAFSAFAAGIAGLNKPGGITVPSVPSAEGIGAASVKLRISIPATASSEAYGAPTIDYECHQITPDGVESALAYGNFNVRSRALILELFFPSTPVDPFSRTVRLRAVQFFAGNHVGLNFVIPDLDANHKGTVPLNLSNKTIKWALTRSRGSVYSDLPRVTKDSLGNGIVKPDPVNGVCRVNVTHLDTVDLQGTFYQELEVFDDFGNSEVVAVGPVMILRNIVN